MKKIIMIVLVITITKIIFDITYHSKRIDKEDMQTNRSAKIWINEDRYIEENFDNQYIVSDGMHSRYELVTWKIGSIKINDLMSFIITNRKED